MISFVTKSLFYRASMLVVFLISPFLFRDPTWKIRERKETIAIIINRVITFFFNGVIALKGLKNNNGDLKYDFRPCLNSKFPVFDTC